MYWAGYRVNVKARDQAKGFAAGVRATRDSLAAQMDLFGGAVFTGSEIAGMIRALDMRELERSATAVVQPTD
jgi:hypothetical protein